MEPLRRLPSEIDETLSRGGTILTASQRAARTLRLDFDRQRRAAGFKSWQPPNIFAWDTWLANLWRQVLVEGRTDRLLLSRSQELQVWRSVVSAEAEAHWTSLQSIDSIATMAADAWQQLCAYRGQSRLKGIGISGDTRAFQRWAQAFTRRCKADLYLSQAELEAALISSSFKPSVDELLLVGFDALTPAQKSLLDTLEEAGVAVASQTPARFAPEMHLATATDLGDELAQAALWLRQTLEANPEHRIAVIHPDIASERAELDRVFRHVLAPELEDITANPASSPYEFSLGHPLSQTSMVAIALKLLRWTIAPLSIDEISHVLLSPYFASNGSERQNRAEFDAFELRHTRLLRPELDLPAFIKQVERSRRAAELRGLLKQLQGLERAHRSSSPTTNKSPSPTGPTTSANSFRPQPGPAPATTTASSSRPAASGRVPSTSSPRSTSKAPAPPSPKLLTTSNRSPSEPSLPGIERRAHPDHEPTGSRRLALRCRLLPPRQRPDLANTPRHEPPAWLASAA